jgi:uncharacterized membrane protein
MAEDALRRVQAQDRTRGPMQAFLFEAPSLAALVVMAVIGLGISIYLTTVHYASAPLVCSAGGIVNCAEVTRSSYSLVPGTNLPITIPGMLWFVASAALAIAAWLTRAREDELPYRIWLAQVAWGAAGLIAVLYLVYAELVKLHAICEWCTGVHILTLLSFLVALFRTLPRSETADAEELLEAD